MTVLCDTSVLVAGCVRLHPHFVRAHPVLETAASGKNDYRISAHSVAEIYSVLTNLPLRPKIVPSEAQVLIRANILPYFKRIPVTADMYDRAVSRCADLCLSGGIVYDALLLECARAAGAARILTFNTRDFLRLAPELAGRISAP